MTTVQPSTRDDVDQAVRRAVVALVELGDLAQLPPADLTRVKSAAATFTREIRAITRRRAPRRGSTSTACTTDPNGEPE